MKITDKKSALAAMDALHAKGVKTVVISSTNFEADHKTLCKAIRVEMLFIPFYRNVEYFALSLLI